jgi:hypothetical protein
LLENNSYDWNGDYVFNEDGSVNITGTNARNPNSLMNVNQRPFPKMSDTGRQQIEQVNESLGQALAPPSRQQFAEQITRLSFHCGMQHKHPRAVEAMMEDYFTDFGHYPYSLLVEACDEYRRKPEGNSFMPNSGQFMALMDRKFRKLKMYKQRSEKLLGIERPAAEGSGQIKLGDFLKRA